MLSMLGERKRKKAYDLLGYLSPEEQAELDALLVDPAAEQGRYRDDPVAFVREILGVERLAPYQEKILTNLAIERRVCVRGPHGMGKCVGFDERVRMADGRLVRAEELVGTHFHVLSINEQFEVVRSMASAEDNGVVEVMEITTDRGRRIIRTLNHPLWADVNPYHYSSGEGRDRKLPVGDWIQCQDLEEGSVIAVYTGNAGAEGARVSDDEIALAAYFLADGGLTSGVTFTKSPGVVLDDFKRICEDMDVRVILSGCDDITYRVSNLQGVGNPVLKRLQAWGMAGKNSYQKAFPSWVWLADDRQLSLFLSRLYGCDGWAHTGTFPNGRQRREIGYCTVSEEMAQDVARALLRLGIHADVRAKKTTCQTGARGIAWCVDLREAEAIIQFCERIGIFSKEEQTSRVYESARSANSEKTQKWRHHGLQSGFIWETIASIRVLPPQPTVAISVPGTHNFLTDFVEHNTSTASWCILWFIATHNECKIPTTASAWRQLTEFLWPEVHKWAMNAKWDRLGLNVRPGKELLGNKLSLGANRFAFALSSTDEAKIEGAHSEAVLYVFDEAKTIDPAIWDAAEGALSTGDAYAIALSTPGESAGRFYDIQMHKEGYEDWNVVHATKNELIAAGRMKIAWADQRLKAWGLNSPLYQRRVLGNFAEDETDSLIKLSWIEAANDRWRDLTAQVQARIADGQDANEAEEIVWGPMTHLGLDPGRHDKAAFAFRHGDNIKRVLLFPDRDLMLTVDRTQMYYRPDTIVQLDTIGIGAGCTDRLRQLHREKKWATDTPDTKPPVRPINVGIQTKLSDKTGELRFGCLRDWLYWHLRELLEDGLIALPPDDILTGDLVAPHWTPDSRGKIVIEKKDDLRKRLGRSPDAGDAVLLAMMPDDPPFRPCIGFI